MKLNAIPNLHDSSETHKSQYNLKCHAHSCTTSAFPLAATSSFKSAMPQPRPSLLPPASSGARCRTPRLLPGCAHSPQRPDAGRPQWPLRHKKKNPRQDYWRSVELPPQHGQTGGIGREEIERRPPISEQQRTQPSLLRPLLTRHWRDERVSQRVAQHQRPGAVARHEVVHLGEG